MSSKKNQSCWNCDHFQPYSETFRDLWGECRKMPLSDKGQVSSRYWASWWPFVSNGSTYWCSEWQKALREVPDVPDLGTPPRWPTDWQRWQPWNIKAPSNVMCWTCNHFEPDDPEDSSMGECRKLSPPPVIDYDLGGSARGTLQSVKTKICGLTRWCGAWERQQNEIPEDPQTPCNDLPTSPSHADLDDMTKAELIAEAEKRKVEISASMSKAEILEALNRD